VLVGSVGFLFVTVSFGSSYLIYGHLPARHNERSPHSNASQCVGLYVRGLLPLSLLLNHRMLNYKMIYVKKLFMHTEFFWEVCVKVFYIYIPLNVSGFALEPSFSFSSPSIIMAHIHVCFKGLKMWLAVTYLRTTKSSEMLY